MFIKNIVKNTTFSFVACAIFYSQIYGYGIEINPTPDRSLSDSLIYDEKKMS